MVTVQVPGCLDMFTVPLASTHPIVARVVLQLQSYAWPCVLALFRYKTSSWRHEYRRQWHDVRRYNFVTSWRSMSMGDRRARWSLRNGIFQLLENKSKQLSAGSLCKMRAASLDAIVFVLLSSEYWFTVTKQVFTVLAPNPHFYCSALHQHQWRGAVI